MNISTTTINADSLYEHRIGEHEAFYIPGFVTVSTLRHAWRCTEYRLLPHFVLQEEEEEYLIRKVGDGLARLLLLLLPLQILESPQQKWKQLANRRYVLSYLSPVAG